MTEYKVGRFSIFISDTVISILSSYKQTGKRKECGGILLGQVIDNSIFILKCSIPTSFDKSMRFGFERDSKLAQAIVNYEFLNSENKTIYLGEWHTHPESIPSPSSPDKKMLVEQLKKNDTNEPFVFLIIQGIEKFNLYSYDGKEMLQGSQK